VKPRHESSTLRSYWFVGLSSDRQLADPAAVALLRELLTELQAESRGGLVGVSSAASGAEMTFARTVLSMGLPWRALLPFSPEVFRQDFEEDDWSKVEELLDRAIELEVRAGHATSDEAAVECGMDTVDQSDVLIVVWDEKPASEPGGTGDIVAYARGLNKPLVILNPEAVTVRRERFGIHTFADHEMDYLNGLPHHAPADEPPATVVPAAMVSFFDKVDYTAATVAPNFRRWVASSIVLNACATVLGACTIAFALQLLFLDAVTFVMTAGAMGAVLFLKYRKVHQKWIQCRVAAEICRAAIATWELPRVVLPEIPNRAQTFSRLEKSIRMLHLTSRPATPPELETLRQKYVAQRLDDQLHYHQKRWTRLAKKRRRLVLLFWVCSVLAVLRAILAGIFGTAGLSPSMALTVDDFLPLALPCIAGCALGLVSVFDFNRQMVHSQEMEGFLQAAREEVEDARSVRSLQRAVERIERLLAREISEWYTLSQEPRYS
jgi:hypothetical protein